MLKVNEIFYSIQGESSFAGLPCIFIRLTGCNLRCSWCDTAYAYEEGCDLTVGAVMARVSEYPVRLAEITGGEPLLQADTPRLAAMLLDRGYTVLVETNGSRDIGLLDRRCVRIVDIKCPGSGQADKNDLENLRRVTRQDEVKFVIASREDFEFARDLLPRISGRLPTKNIHFSPVCGIMTSVILAEWMLEDGIEARLSLQMHKSIWPDRPRGA